MPILKTSYPGLRIIPSKITTTADPAVTQTYGQDLTLANSSEGEVGVTYNYPFQRGSVGLFVPATAVDNAGYCATNDGSIAGSASTLQWDTLADDGSADNGLAYGMMAGWDAQYNKAHPFQRFYDVKCNEPGATLLGFAWNTSSETVTEGASLVTRTNIGTGVDRFDFVKPFASDNVIAIVTVWHESACRLATITSLSHSSITLAQWALDPVAAFGYHMHVLVLGYSKTTVTGGRRAILRTPQPKARLHALKIETSAGTPAITLGDGDASLVDTGVGRYTLTWAKPFKRKPLVLLCGDTGLRSVVRAEPSVTGCEVNLYNAAGDTLTDGNVNILVYGCDQAVQV